MAASASWRRWCGLRTRRARSAGRRAFWRRGGRELVDLRCRWVKRMRNAAIRVARGRVQNRWAHRRHELRYVVAVVRIRWAHRRHELRRVAAVGNDGATSGTCRPLLGRARRRMVRTDENSDYVMLLQCRSSSTPSGHEHELGVGSSTATLHVLTTHLQVTRRRRRRRCWRRLRSSSLTRSSGSPVVAMCECVSRIVSNGPHPVRK